MFIYDFAGLQKYCQISDILFFQLRLHWLNHSHFYGDFFTQKADYLSFSPCLLCPWPLSDFSFSRDSLWCFSPSFVSCYLQALCTDLHD